MAGSSDLNAEMYNMINTFNAQRNNICDTQCQNDNKIRQLYSTVTKAEDNLADAPTALLDAQRKLSTYDTTYKMTFDKNIQTMANNEINKLETQFDNTKENIYQNLDYYNTQTAFENSVNNMKNYYSQKLQDSQKTIATEKGNTAINHRMAQFYSKEITLVDWVISYLAIIYWILISILIDATLILFYNKNVNNKGHIILTIVILLVIPLYRTLLPFFHTAGTIFSLFPTP